MKTLLDIILGAWLGQGGKGRMPRKFVRQWLNAHPAYQGHVLSTRFNSGSSVAVRPLYRLDRATAAWLATGHGPPTTSDFDEFLRSYRDEYDEYDAAEPPQNG